MPSCLNSSQMPMRRSFACLGSASASRSSKFVCLRPWLTSSVITQDKGATWLHQGLGSDLNGSLHRRGSTQSRRPPGRADERIRPSRALRGIGPPGLENLNDEQGNGQREKDLFHAGLVHRKLSAIGKSLTLGLASIENPSIGRPAVESQS